MKHFLIALQFLTILPIDIGDEIGEGDFAKSLAYFPLVGLFIGIFLVLITSIIFNTFNFFSNLVMAALILIASCFITGGIHIDGLADTCDALCGLRDRDEALKIMKDSHIGAMGVIGIVLIMLLKFSLLTVIQRNILLQTLLVMPVFGRWAQTFACFYSEYPREDGKARDFIQHAGKRELTIATPITLVIFFIFLQWSGIAIFIASIIPMLFPFFWIKKKINGMTGDTIGAMNELAEVSVLFFCFIVPGLLNQ